MTTQTGLANLGVLRPLISMMSTNELINLSHTPSSSTRAAINDLASSKLKKIKAQFSPNALKMFKYSANVDVKDSSLFELIKIEKYIAYKLGTTPTQNVLSSSISESDLASINTQTNEGISAANQLLDKLPKRSKLARHIKAKTAHIKDPVRKAQLVLRILQTKTGIDCFHKCDIQDLIKLPAIFFQNLCAPESTYAYKDYSEEFSTSYLEKAKKPLYQKHYPKNIPHLCRNGEYNSHLLFSPSLQK